MFQYASDDSYEQIEGKTVNKEKTKIEKTEKTEKIEKKETKEENILQEGKVGTMLRDVRTKKKLTIEDVADKLRIKPAYLTAIENSDYDSIPQPPYGIGFVQSYANFLGLNSARIVQIFKEEMGEPSIPVTTLPTEQPISEEEAPTSNRKYIIISLILLILCYGLWNRFAPESSIEETPSSQEIASTSENQEYPMQIETYTEMTETPVEELTSDSQINISEDSFVDNENPISSEAEQTIETTEETRETEKTTEQTSTSEAETQPSETPVETKKKGRVVLKIKKETWVEVKDKDKLWISKVLNAGDEYVLPENGVGKTVSFGNTDGVDVVIDGKIVTIISNNKKTNIKMDAFLGNH